MKPKNNVAGSVAVLRIPGYLSPGRKMIYSTLLYGQPKVNKANVHFDRYFACKDTCKNKIKPVYFRQYKKYAIEVTVLLLFVK